MFRQQSGYILRYKTGVIHYILIAFYEKFNFLSLTGGNSPKPAAPLRWQNHLFLQLIETVISRCRTFQSQPGELSP
jgi:hypothetical protein